MQKILALTPEKAREIGIKHRSTLKKIEDGIINDGKINLGTKEVKKL